MFSRKMVLIVGFIVLIAVNIIGLSVTSRRSAAFGIERIAMSAIAPFQELVTRSLRFTRDIWRHYFYLVTVARENHVLMHQLSQAVENKNQWHETDLANTRLRDLIDFQ
jgi:rod shape-determining protein MreC